jgi:hypothetical protein
LQNICRRAWSIYAIGREAKFIITISLIYGASLFNMLVGPVA